MKMTPWKQQFGAPRENKEILPFPLGEKSESSNFLFIFGAGKLRRVYL